MAKQSTKNAKRKTQKIRRSKYLNALQKSSEDSSMKKMINSNPRGGLRSGRYTASKGGTPARRLSAGGPARTGYKKGNKVEMHKCMPN